MDKIDLQVDVVNILCDQLEKEYRQGKSTIDDTRNQLLKETRKLYEMTYTGTKKNKSEMVTIQSLSFVTHLTDKIKTKMQEEK